MTLSPLDDYPVHQIAETIRHVGTSDRNFYDRYYLNGFALDGSAMFIAGIGLARGYHRRLLPLPHQRQGQYRPRPVWRLFC